MRFEITYKRSDLNDGVDYTIPYNSTTAQNPEQALQELRQRTQHPAYPAISHAEQIRVRALDEPTQ